MSAKKVTKNVSKRDTATQKLPDLVELESVLGRAKQQVKTLHVVEDMLRLHETQPCMLTIDGISYAVDNNDPAIVAILKKREDIGWKNIRHTLAEMKKIIDSTGMFQQ
jgi:hypothetical protein